MSILLDALKKSESQRLLGQTPTIHTAIEASGAKRETELHWIALSMLVLSAVAIAWFVWQQYRQPVLKLDDAGVDVVALPQVAETPLVETQAPAEARQRREKLSQSFNSYEAEKNDENDREVALSSPAIAQDSSGPAAPQPAPDQLRSAEETKALTSPSRSMKRQPHQSEPISFWQLPQAMRDGLPEFRINVLVYAEKPEDRFLLINGQRLVEKEELTAGVVLDEIRRDGAVFRYRNYRFLVKG